MQMQRILLITVSVTVLYLSCTVHAMPLSWSKSVRHRRSRTESSATESPTLSSDPGRIQLQNPLDVNPNAGGATNSTTNQTNFQNETYMQICMRECYESILPRERIETLKREIKYNPHPSFHLSEWLENEHRLRFCNNTYFDNESKLFCEDRQPQLVNRISQRLMNETLEAFKPINDIVYNCISQYGITYNSTYYPRYLFQVKCASDTRIRVGMKSLRLHNATWDIYEQLDVTVGCT